MVKRTVETYECDVCGNEGDRYTLIFPEGTLAMDRCEAHAVKILKLRDEKGTWTKAGSVARENFKVSTPEDIARQRKS